MAGYLRQAPPLLLDLNAKAPQHEGCMAEYLRQALGLLLGFSMVVVRLETTGFRVSSGSRVMEEVWRRSGGGLEEVWRRSRGGLEEVWRRSGGGLEEWVSGF